MNEISYVLNVKYIIQETYNVIQIKLTAFKIKKKNDSLYDFENKHILYYYINPYNEYLFNVQMLLFFFFLSYIRDLDVLGGYYFLALFVASLFIVFYLSVS